MLPLCYGSNGLQYMVIGAMGSFYPPFPNVLCHTKQKSFPLDTYISETLITHLYNVRFTRLPFCDYRNALTSEFFSYIP